MTPNTTSDLANVAADILDWLAPCFSGEVRRRLPTGAFMTLAKNGCVWMLSLYRVEPLTAAEVDQQATAFGAPVGVVGIHTEDGRRVTMQWEVGE